MLRIAAPSASAFDSGSKAKHQQESRSKTRSRKIAFRSNLWLKIHRVRSPTVEFLSVTHPQAGLSGILKSPARSRSQSNFKSYRSSNLARTNNKITSSNKLSCETPYRSDRNSISLPELDCDTRYHTRRSSAVLPTADPRSAAQSNPNSRRTTLRNNHGRHSKQF